MGLAELGQSVALANTLNNINDRTEAKVNAVIAFIFETSGDGVLPSPEPSEYFREAVSEEANDKNAWRLAPVNITSADAPAPPEPPDDTAPASAGGDSADASAQAPKTKKTARPVKE